ncbi:NUDIX domain-containing protein [Terasakiella sp. A23]|uniref:NUDIX domain-containing protein n=1 Tax=Terasakiella sp. FCG-A23 TaxID=3080561 RepID=UPI0029539B40|nr:NUDIX domain-containing protein [Terasakiella sp. A23]MDV7338809.1 NUDIX domain-containing protein [Terasakiella sp. A23]
MAKSNADHAKFTADNVEVIEKKTPFNGYFQIDALTLRHKKHDGGWTDAMTREIFERGHAAGMLLYDPKLDVVILIEQFRPGAFAAGYNPWLLEIPAGIIEEGQSAESVAVRETEEETGCHAKRVEFICDYLVSPGGTTESMHLYCVEVNSTEAFEVGGLEHEGEDIAVVKVSSQKAFELLENGNLHNSMTIIAVQWLKLQLNEIRQKWCE